MPRILLVLCTGIFCLASAGSVSAASARPSLKVNPNKVAINQHATFVGRHLWPNTRVTMVLAVPALVKNATEKFIGNVERTNGSGYFKLSTRMPVVTRCGKATVYVAPFIPKKGQTAVRSHIALIGCNATGGKAPPPPPSGKKKH